MQRVRNLLIGIVAVAFMARFLSTALMPFVPFAIGGLLAVGAVSALYRRRWPW